ncbi:MAG: hypothetical protein HYZ42_03755 [Bacteroidetes bacterium]|nr:hypothetical protein [Bacteroidota bacterium]
MSNQKLTVAKLLKDFEYRYEPRTVFDDFLTMTICALSIDPATGKSRYEDLYMETIEKYKSDELRHHFPKKWSVFYSLAYMLFDGKDEWHKARNQARAFAYT